MEVGKTAPPLALGLMPALSRGFPMAAGVGAVGLAELAAHLAG